MNIGSYDVVRQISEGSFGRTFYATHRLLKEPACLKQEKTGEPEYQRLFREEAKLLWNLRHVSLPAMRDYLELPGMGQVIAMSFVPGEHLGAILEKGAVDDEHVCWILQRVLDALSYLHYHRVVHGDIKPQNVILDIPTHNATLVDFGLAAVAPDAKTRAKGGTRFYLPPEFALGLPPIPASDLYALGMTAVALAGGDVRTGTLPADMHPELQEIVGAMVRRDPLARPQTADEVVDALGRFRRRAYGRSSTREAFKHRGGTS